MNYYTYAYLREDGTPYYIGKGKGRRATSKAKTHKVAVPPLDRIVILKQNLTEAQAFAHERYMVAVLGRKDLGTGILRNRTDGGDGSSGWRAPAETRERMSVAKKGEKNHFYGKSHSRELLRQIGQSNPLSRVWILTSPTGEEFEMKGIHLFCKDHGLDRSALGRVAQGKQKQHKGWTARYK